LLKELALKSEALIEDSFFVFNFVSAFYCITFATYDRFCLAWRNPATARLGRIAARASVAMKVARHGFVSLNLLPLGF
jgi:hypothetical protein